MGQLIKNTQLRTGSTAIRLPTGTTAERPSAAATGQLRYNTDTSRFEFYNGSAWASVASRGFVTVSKDTFTGDGSTLAYTKSTTPNSETGTPVYIGNVHQNPGVAYTMTGSTITFSTPPNAGQTIEIYHGFDSTDR